MRRLMGKTALVTGSAWGIGRATVLALAEAGANVVVHYRESEEAARGLVERIRQLGPRSDAIRADLTDAREIHHLVADAARLVGPPDILVNNVGDFLLKPVNETTSAEWRHIFATNTESVFVLTRSVLPHMREGRWGRVINLTTSPVDRAGAAPRTAAYTAAKAAVSSFTRTLAREEVTHGITVNAVAPGLIDSGPERTTGEFRKLMQEISPTGELGTPEDVARVILFLALPDSGYITGAQIAVAGGYGL
jgi:3-oxoacyl-[acyl-carrier protein] reductase